MGQPFDLRVVETDIAVLDAEVPDEMDGGLKLTLVAAGLPEAENVAAFCVEPPVVVRLIVKLAFAPAATVTVVGRAAAMLKSTPTPLSAVV